MNQSFAVTGGRFAGVDVEVRVDQVAVEAVTNAGSARLPAVVCASIEV